MSKSSRRPEAIQLTCFLAGLFMVWTLRATLFYAVDESISNPLPRAAYSQLLKLILWVLPAAAFGYWLRGLPPTRYLGLHKLPDPRKWLESLGVITGFLLVVILVETISGRKSFLFAGAANWLTAVGVLHFIVTPLLEELLFRGMVLRELLALMPPWRANLLTSMLFVGIHLPFWLTQDDLSLAVLGNAAGVFIFSLVAGWLWSQSTSIWPPFLAHVANNLLASMLVASPA